MSTLRARFVVAFVLAALLPMGAVGWWSRHTIIEQTRAEYRERLAATAESAERRVTERAQRDQRAVDRLCERDFVIDRLLLDLAAERFDAKAQEDLVSLFPTIARSLGLDVLEVIQIGSDGAQGSRVLAAAHFPGRSGANAAPTISAVRANPGHPFVTEVKIRRDGRGNTVRSWLTACETHRNGAHVAVVGGRRLDEDFVGSLLGNIAPVDLVLTGPTGRIPKDVEAGSGRESVHTFRGPRGEPALRLVAVIDDGPLKARLQELDRGYLGGAAIALLGALLLGTLLVVGLTRPLRELELAAQRVAEGDLESTIDVHRGGEVGRALTAFNRMTEELRATRERLLRAERIAAWRDIARRIAHEVKNPLSPIQVSIETMRKTYAKKHPDFDEIFDESTLAILEEVERLKRIVTEFSRFARLPRPRAEPLDVTAVLEHVVGLNAPHDVAMEAELDPDLPQARGDREQLTQVFVNLVQNAVEAARARHASHGGRVTVTASPDPRTGGVVVRIADNGPGIPAEERQRVFEPYFTTKATGTGLGLAIVHRIVSDHGGTIAVAPSPEGGAELTVRLRPEGPPPAVEASQSDTALPLVRRAAPDGRRGTGDSTKPDR
jgi:signal transduction histidine kinase